MEREPHGGVIITGVGASAAKKQPVFAKSKVYSHLKTLGNEAKDQASSKVYERVGR